MLPDRRYAPLIIKHYTYWTLFLHTQQLPYLGRCYAWWNDRKPGEGEGMQLNDIPQDASQELFRDIYGDILTGLRALGYFTERYGSAFLLNTCYLANEPMHNHHMHWHFIPRHAGVLTCSALPFVGTDRNWKGNYTPYDKTENLHPDLIFKTRLLMAKAIVGAIV